MGFTVFKLNKHIQKALAEKNYSLPTPVQNDTIPLILERKDIIASAQTGTGKTAAFALPIIQLLFDKQEASKKGKRIRALVLAPTRELAIQIAENFKTYSKYSQLKVTVVYGGIDIAPQKKELKQGTDILIATPGRLLDLQNQSIVNLKTTEILVLDEADLMLDMGFINDIHKIDKLTSSRLQTLLFSATIPDNVAELGRHILHDPIEINSQPNAAQQIDQKLFFVPISKKMQLCVHLLNAHQSERTIIFRRTKFGVEKLDLYLKEKGFKVESIHGGKSQALRQEALKTFKNGGANILIATDVAARGIDIDALELVINFDIPNKPETYIHRIGRTGRADRFGQSFAFCAAEERHFIPSIQNLTKSVISVVEDHPFPLAADAQPTIHKRKGSKYKKGRKSEASKKKKKRWY